MSESIAFVAGAPRAQIYREILPQIEALLCGDAVADFANVAAEKYGDSGNVSRRFLPYTTQGEHCRCHLTLPAFAGHDTEA